MSPLLASGEVWHERQEPSRYAFSYRMTYLWCDIDALDRGEAAGRWISAGPGGLFQLRRADHLQGTDGNWRTGIEAWLEKAQIESAPRIHLLTLPRMLGRTFNPVSFWIGTRDDSQVMWMVAEVNNTFGDRHLYPLDASGRDKGSHSWHAPKSFPVSPFHGVEGEYEFRLDLSESVIRIGVDLSRHGEGKFRTGMRMDLVPFQAKSLALSIAAMAFSVVSTVPRILWHAARLHFGGKARLHPYVAGADPWTIHRGQAVLLQRLVANPAMGRIWKRLGQILTKPQIPKPGAEHGTGNRPHPDPI